MFDVNTELKWPSGLTIEAVAEKNNTLEGLLSVMTKIVAEEAPFREQVEHFRDAVYEILGIGDAEISYYRNLQRITQ